MSSATGTANLLTPENKSQMKAESSAGERDIFREIPLRYAGYANEVGEAFRNMIRLRFVYFSYAVSSGYVVSHAIAKGLSTRSTCRREQNNNNNMTLLKSGSTSDRVEGTHTGLHNSYSSVHHNFGSLLIQKQNQLLSPACALPAPVSTTAAIVDTLLWQGLASVVIPGLTINRLCAGSRVLLNRYVTKVLSRQVRQWLVTGVGLCSIPLIIHPIDWAVDKFMDSLVRPHFHNSRQK